MMRNLWRRKRRPPTPSTEDPSGTDLLIRWIDAITSGLAQAPPGPPEATPARICDGMFTAATIMTVLRDRVADRPEYRTANDRCTAASVGFMKVLGEDTLRRYRIPTEVQLVSLEQVSAGADEMVIARHLGWLGEALQLALCAVTTDPTVPADIKASAAATGLIAADALVASCEAVRSDPAN